MVQKKQYDILLQGVGAWNQWRKANPTITPDLTAANLAGAVLVSADLSGANLAGANLSEARLDRAVLAHADLKGANLSYASLTRADLTDANLNNAVLRFAQLYGTLLVCADLTWADISSARFEKTDTTAWIITNISCTEIVQDGETTCYETGRFEQTFARPERVIQIVLDAPASILTHHIGQLIEVYFNRYFGGTVLAFRGQMSLTNNQTTQKYGLLRESEEERIQSRLEVVRTGIGYIMKDGDAWQLAKRLSLFSTSVGTLAGDPGQDQQTVENALDIQHAALKPLLQKTIRAIQEVLKRSPT